MIESLKRFFPAKGGYIIGPLAVVSFLGISSFVRSGVATSLNIALFALEVLAFGLMAYSMFWKQRKTEK